MDENQKAKILKVGTCEKLPNVGFDVQGWVFDPLNGAEDYTLEELYAIAHQ